MAITAITPRIIQLYAGEPGIVETEFPNEFYIALIQGLELQLSAYRGLGTAPAGGLLELQIRRIEKDRDDALQDLAKANKTISTLKSTAGKGALSQTEEVVDWSTIHADFKKDDGDLVRKWKKTGTNFLDAYAWISYGLANNDYCYVKWLREIKTLTPVDYNARSATDKTALRAEYETINTVDTDGYNWNTIDATFNQNLKASWEAAGFNFIQTWSWIENGFRLTDYDFCNWLINVKNLSDPAQILKTMNMGLLRGEYNTFVVKNKHGVITFKATAINSTDLAADRKVEFTVSAGALRLSGFSPNQITKLTAANINVATQLQLLYNLDPTHTGTPEESAYNAFKSIITGKTNKDISINIIDADKIRVVGNAVQIEFGIFDDIEFVGHTNKPLTPGLISRKNALTTIIDNRLTKYGLTSDDLDAYAVAKNHWGQDDRPTKWRDYVNQIIYDIPSGASVGNKFDYNYSDVKGVILGGLTSFVVEWFLGTAGTTGAPNTANTVPLQEYINENRSPTDTAYYNSKKHEIEAVGVSLKKDVSNWNNILAEIKTFFNPSRSLAEIRNKGQELLDNYVDPMNGINLNGAARADVLNLPADNSAANEINGADDFDRTFTFYPKGSTVSKTVRKYFLSNKAKYQKYTPLITQGGGNCFLHSLNIHLTGANDGRYILNLRAALCLGVMTNQNWIPNPTKGGQIAEQAVADYIRNILINRKIDGQYCRLAYHDDLLGGDDIAFASDLLGRPLTLVYKTNGDKIAGWATGKYCITSTQTSLPGTTFTYDEPWHIYHIGTNHYEAFPRHEDHNEIILNYKPTDIQYVDKDNVGNNRSVEFTVNAGDLTANGFSTAHNTDITNLQLNTATTIILDYKATNGFTNDRWEFIKSMLNKENDTADTIDKMGRKFILSVSDYSKIVSATDTITITPEHFDIDITPRQKLLFYNSTDPYYEFTNFWEGTGSVVKFSNLLEVQPDGTLVKNTTSTTPEAELQARTPEHAYQYFKFQFSGQPAVANAILGKTTAREALQEADNNNATVNVAWHGIKVKVMEWILNEKFSKDNALKALLKGTDDKELIENSPTDRFWGIGTDGSGQNELGKLLMKLRETI